MQIRLAHIGEDQILLVRNSQFAERLTIREDLDRTHRPGAQVAWRGVGFLK